MKAIARLLIAVFFVTYSITVLPAADDILIADFEGETYGSGWTVGGTAFGTGPARGKIDGQMDVTGYLGRGLVNSFLGGDNSKGRLTSPTFKIERPFLSFLIGGGGHKGLEVNLIVDGKTARTATGPNTVPGGNETLNWNDWDVSDLQGKEAHIEIVDDATGGWGHINVDHIIQTDRRREPVEKRVTFSSDKKFLHIPISMDAPVTWVRVEVDGQWQQEFDCPLAVDDGPGFYANLEIGRWKGKKITLIAEKVPSESHGLAMLRFSDEMSHEDIIYTEQYRPQFHYTTRTGWINDPNGLLHYNGTWHLFTQHNPYSTKWGNMTWGHAVSPDLVHWTEQPDAIHPDKLGTIFSGSGVVDWNNTSGFQDSSQKGDEKPLVLIFTYNGPSARFGNKASQAIAYSTDGGKTFEKYEGNPVLPHIVGGNRDPKVIWYEPTKTWIMALYMDREDYSLFGSKDLKNWEKLCDINNLGCSECPDFFPLPVDGDKSNVKWLFWGGNGKYLLGAFNGREFKRETEPLTNKYGGNDYAAMTFSDSPDGRRIQLSWMNGGRYPGMPFNQQYTVPREMTLRTTPKGVRLFMEPVKEIETLRYDLKESRNLKFTARNEGLLPFDGDLFDAEIVFDLSKSKKTVLDVAGQRIEYNAEKNEISLDGARAPLELQNGKLKLRILVDRCSIEIFAQNGEVQIAKCFVPRLNVSYKGISVLCEGGDIVVDEAKLWKMKSIWGRTK